MRKKPFALAVTIAAVMSTLAMPASARTIADSTGVNPLHGVVGKDERDRANEGIDQVTGGGPFCGFAVKEGINPGAGLTGSGSWVDYSSCNGAPVRPAQLVRDSNSRFGFKMVESCPEGYKFRKLAEWYTERDGPIYDSIIQGIVVTYTCARDDF